MFVVVVLYCIFFLNEEMEESHGTEWQKSKVSGTDPTRFEWPGSRQPSVPELLVIYKGFDLCLQLDHSFCARMTWILTTCLCFTTMSKSMSSFKDKSVCVLSEPAVCPRVTPSLLPALHQISTLEKTIFRQLSTLSGLMSKRPSQVSPFWAAAQSTSMSDFSPNFLMEWRQARQEFFRYIARLNSSSTSILLWSFLHLNLVAFFSTSLQNTLQN